MADIDDMINNVVNQDFSKSQTYFDAIMQAKMSDSLEQEKIAMANKIFNLDNPEGENYEEPTETEEELEDDSEEFSDEELDAAAEESLEDNDEEEDDDEEDDELEDYSDEEE